MKIMVCYCDVLKQFSACEHSATTVFTHFCLRYTKDKERFEALFVFRISKKTIDLYAKQMLCGHFSQNILVFYVYVRPCFKWFSGNAFFIRFHMRTKNRKHVFKRWQVYFLNGYRTFVSYNVETFGNIPIPTYEEWLRTFTRQEDRNSPHVLTEHPPRRPRVMSVSQKHQK